MMAYVRDLELAGGVTNGPASLTVSLNQNLFFPFAWP